jgi:hypothetical protein
MWPLSMVATFHGDPCTIAEELHDIGRYGALSYDETCVIDMIEISFCCACDWLGGTLTWICEIEV